MFIKEKQLYLRALDGLVLPKLITVTCPCVRVCVRVCVCVCEKLVSALEGKVAQAELASAS